MDEEYLEQLRSDLFWAQLMVDEILSPEWDGEEVYQAEIRYYKRRIKLLTGLLGQELYERHF